MPIQRGCKFGLNSRVDFGRVTWQAAGTPPTVFRGQFYPEGNRPSSLSAAVPPPSTRDQTLVTARRTHMQPRARPVELDQLKESSKSTL